MDHATVSRTALDVAERGIVIADAGRSVLLQARTPEDTEAWLALLEAAAALMK